MNTTARSRPKKFTKTATNKTISPSTFNPYFLGRKTSILLDGDDASQSVVLNKELLKHHKTHGAVPHAQAPGQIQMSEEEFTWWSNPFLRMLASPLRSCVLTKRLAPKDHLIRLTATLLPAPDTPASPSTPSYLIPTELHHSRYARRPDGLGTYITCSKLSIPLLFGKGRHRGTYPGAQIHDSIGDQITSGLQARCAEEAELLMSRILSSPIIQPSPLGIAVRRLTVLEYKSALEHKTISDSNVSAVLVIPKTEVVSEPRILRKTDFLLRTSGSGAPHAPDLPPPRVPILFGSALLQDNDIRARLRVALDKALSAERHALQKARSRFPELQAWLDLPYEPKAKDAYGLCASRRADTVPLIVALWRLKMWEDEN